MAPNVASAEVEPQPSQVRQAASRLQHLGFRILHIGQTISVEGSRSLWESTFNISFESQKKKTMEEVPGSEVTYLRAPTSEMQIPSDLQEFIARVEFAEPPEFF